MEKPDSGIRAIVFFGLLAAATPIDLARRDFSLALGGPCRSPVGAGSCALPAHDLVLGEADIRLDPHIRYKSALDF